ncbi:MAG: hypothetical protein EOM85_03570 [Candidatus Moranbacteria bacterium]|nr:hypothetical protein [Candidatus Moranbacteria bacterium]
MNFTREEIVKGKNRLVYNALFNKDNFLYFEDKIHRTGPNTYQIKEINNLGKCGTLIKIFDIENSELFKQKYQQAISGKGDEEKNILTLISSSLCALLFFYNVTEDNSLMLNLNGSKVIFTESIFEFKSRVISPRAPSNVDVTLLGRDENGKKVILFIEAKLTEYYLGISLRSAKISNAYLISEYGRLIYGGNIGYRIEMFENQFKLASLIHGEKSYVNGVKQMISHFIGVQNGLNRNYANNDIDILNRVTNCIENENAKAYLGSIIFDKNIGILKLDESRTAIGDYRDRYEVLQKVISKVNNNERFEMLESLLVYSVFENNDFNVEDRIKQFYF